MIGINTFTVEFCHIFKEDIFSMLHKYFNIKEKEGFPYARYEASISQVPKPKKILQFNVYQYALLTYKQNSFIQSCHMISAISRLVNTCDQVSLLPKKLIFTF